MHRLELVEDDPAALACGGDRDEAHVGIGEGGGALEEREEFEGQERVAEVVVMEERLARFVGDEGYGEVGPVRVTYAGTDKKGKP